MPIHGLEYFHGDERDIAERMEDTECSECREPGGLYESGLCRSCWLEVHAARLKAAEFLTTNLTGGK